MMTLPVFINARPPYTASLRTPEDCVKVLLAEGRNQEEILIRNVFRAAWAAKAPGVDPMEAENAFLRDLYLTPLRDDSPKG